MNFSASCLLQFSNLAIFSCIFSPTLPKSLCLTPRVTQNQKRFFDRQTAEVVKWA